jgi:hypothetical protein
MIEKPSEKQLEARNTLPEELRAVFDDFVSDYKYAASRRHGRPYISYIVLADMVRAGWRLSADPISEEKEENIKKHKRQNIRKKK